MGASPSRGAGWVWVQSAVMLAWVGAGPATSGTWHSAIGFALGAFLFLLAAAVGLTGVAHLDRNRTPFPRPRPGSRLIQRGIYGWVRHPLYLSVMLAGFSWALLWQSGLTAVLALLQMPFFDAKARLEERWLTAAFPEYLEYRRRVRRFLPGLY